MPRPAPKGVQTLKTLLDIRALAPSGTLEIAVFADNGTTVTETITVPVTSLIGLTPENIDKFFAVNSNESDEVKKLRGLITRLRRDGFDELVDNAERHLQELIAAQK